MVFSTIQPTPGLEASRRRTANRLGPPAVAVPTSYESLLRSAGFVDVVVTDLTADYRATQRRWMDATERRELAMRGVMGDQMYDERLATRRETLQAIDDGLLTRFLYTAVR